MLRIIMHFFNNNDINNFIYENEIKILYIILISILLSHITLFIINLFYLKNIKNKAFQIDEINLKENDKLKELQNLMAFSYKICKISFVILPISILFLSFEILNFIRIKEDDFFKLIIPGYIYYYIVNIASLIFFSTLTVISIYLYYRYNKKYFKKYLKFDMFLLILNIVLYIIGDIIYYYIDIY